MTLLTILIAVFNTVWQGAAMAALVWLALKCARMNAATRCVIWWLVLGALVVLPFAPRPILRWNHRHVTPAASPLPEPLPADRPAIAELPAIVTLPEKPANGWPFAVFGIWAAILVFRLSRIRQSYLYLRRVKRNATVSDLRLPYPRRRARLLLSSDIVSPMAIGFRHAAVVLPLSLIESISSCELDQILLHESAHLARRDDWWNLLARCLGAVLALHPIAWWILRQIDYEREAACDDWVVARTGAVRPYAETLAHMAELRWRSAGSYRAQETLASGVFGSGSKIGNRIEELLETGRQFSARVSLTRVVAGCFVLCSLAVAGTFAPRWVAFAKAPVLKQVVAAIITPPAPVPAPEPLLLAQAAPAPPVSQAVPADKPETPRFEVASIRPAVFPGPEYAAGFYQGSAGAGNKLCGAKFSISGTLVSIPRISVCQLIALAYGVQGYQIVGAPELLRASGGQGFPDIVQAGIAVVDKNPSFFYDIEARAPGKATPTEDDVRAMLRDLLADRFQLKLHHDTKELAYAALVAGKNGIKLTATREDCRPANNSSKDAQRNLFVTDVHVCGRSIQDLARSISSYSDKPVVDKTGLTGTFDYDFRVQVDDPQEIGTVTLEAYRNQLGLVLESRKGPVDVLVVDHVEAPSGN